VYFFLDAEKSPLYIGKALDLRKRLVSYWSLGPDSDRAHLLAMLKATRSVEWEICASEAEAIRRESQLIRDFLPAYNIAGAWETEDFLILIAPEAAGKIRFELIFEPEEPLLDSRLHGKHVFGCIRNDRRSKKGYPALLRLLHLLGTRERWYHHPAAISRSYLPYDFQVTIPPEFLPRLVSFLDGRSWSLLREISMRLLENDAVPTFLSASIQQDLSLARDFFRGNIRLSRLATRQLDRKRKARFLTSVQLRAFVRNRGLETLRLRRLK
jgi:hypothetical protein